MEGLTAIRRGIVFSQDEVGFNLWLEVKVGLDYLEAYLEPCFSSVYDVILFVFYSLFELNVVQKHLVHLNRSIQLQNDSDNRKAYLQIQI